MTILAELAALYERRAEREGWSPPGFSSEKIGAEVVLAPDGSVVAIRSLMAPDEKGKMQPRVMSVPAAVKRTSGIRPNHFWDKTSYALGVTAIKDGDDILAGQGKKTESENGAFLAENLDLVAAASDSGLRAFATFCQTWIPAMIADFPDAVPLLDRNVTFSFEDGTFLHDLPEARALLEPSMTGTPTTCLVTGRLAPAARLHPTIKGVAGAQSSGASLVSFNNDAETSHGHAQGDNAPTTEAAAFAYGTALNALLARGSGRNLRLGDATVVFWASAAASGEDTDVEDALATAFGAGTGSFAEHSNEGLLQARLVTLAQGKIPEGSTLDPAARVYVLGLSPNAARIAVRFWHVDTLGAVAGRVTRFWEECAVEPSPFQRGDAFRLPRPAALLYDIAAQHDGKNIPPNLAGDLMRAILTGHPYPSTLLPAVIGRLRVEGDPDRKIHGELDGRRAALIRAFLIRNFNWEVPMALNETEDDVAYLLGRLFGAYVYAERSYQDRGASLRAKYLGAASATPARVFPVLMRGYEHNLASLRKAGGHKSGAGVKADRAVAAILDRLPGNALPATLRLEDQGRFFVGFYHQISAFYTKAEDAADDLIDMADEGEHA